jgi:pectate lyase
MNNIFLFFCLIGSVALAQPLAFPGADGAGKFTRGGRGGKVIEVTSLADNTSPGTLRYAVNQTGARTVVFRVSGTIILNSELNITKDSITIAGQTAPGDGICLRKFPIRVSANQVVIRYLRSRLGDESGGESDAFNGYSGTNYAKKNIIIDHCSSSWSQDETMTFYGYDSMTVQWCIISESMYNSSHPKGAHGYGGIWGGTNASYHHNLIAHHSSRTPRFSGKGTTVECLNLDFRNNVIYNWGFNNVYGGEASTVNIVGNYYKYGPATSNSVKSRIVQPLDAAAQWYVADNYVDGYPAVTVDNWQGVAKDKAVPVKAATSFSNVLSSTDEPEAAYQRVLLSAGAVLPKRDTIDSRIVYETMNRTALAGGTTYAKDKGLDTTKKYGIIDSQSDAGGWPEYRSAAAPLDTDHDGMPDAWESLRGLNPNDPSDRNLTGSGGYTKLEEYLNELAGTPASVRHPSSRPTGFQLFQNFPNPFNPSTVIRYAIGKKSRVSLCLFDALGNSIAVLESGEREAGEYRCVYESPAELASGVYFCRLNAGDYQNTIKLALLR